MGVVSCFPGGGAALNLKAYAAAGNLPASAAEGAVGVITAAAIGDVFASVSAPAWPSDGDVWVWLGGSTRAPIALSGQITLAPRAVYQCVSGAWAIKPAYVYTSGAWVEVTMYVYNAGAELLSTFSIGSRSREATTLTKNPANMVIYRQAGGDAGSTMSVMSDTAIDFTSVSSIKITYTRVGAYETVNLVAGSSRTSYTYNATANMAAGTNLTATLDVSELSGIHYIGVYSSGGANLNSNTISVTEIWLER